MGKALNSAVFMRTMRRSLHYFMAVILAVSTLTAISGFVSLENASAADSQYAFDFNKGASNTVMKTADGTRVIPATTDFTVEAWVYVDSDTNAWQTILVQDQAEALMNNGRFYVGFPGGRNLHLGAGTQSKNTTVQIPLQTWTHVAVSVDRTGTSTRATTYINGTSVDTWDFTSVDYSTAQGFSIGTATDGGYELDGKIDQVKIWNGVLSQSDIATSKSAYAAAGITTGTLAAHYDFNEGSGSTVNDRSGNGLNLALTAGSSAYTQTPTPPTTTSSAPTNVAGTAGNGQVALTWSAPNFNGGASITGYTVTSSPSVAAPAGCTNTANLSCTFTGLTNGTAYTFTVVAINSAGNSASSAASSSVTPLTTAGAPTSLSATVGNSQVALSWTAPTSNGGSAITDYLVQYSTDGTNFTTFADGVSTTASATVTGLVNGTAYTFKVSTVNAAGTGTGATVSPTPFASCTPASSISGGFTTLTFTSSTTCFWSVPAGVTAAHVVAVGGGGGGGADGGGGGGGGGVYENTSLSVTPNAALIVTIGQGGAGGNGYKDGSGNCTSSFATWSSTVVGCDGAKGSKTFFGSISASGGGGGGGIESSGTADFDSSTTARGGGGGAGAQNSKAGTGSAGVGGFTGGSVSDSSGNAAAGGAGAGANGSASSGTAAGAGGAGITATLNSIVYGSGGGGGSYNNATAALGGANAANGGSQNAGPTDPTANRGGGGGGGGNGATAIRATGTTGAAGVVIVKYLSTYTVTYSYNGANAGNGTTSATFTPGGTAITLPTPTKTGFSFSGWYTASTGGSLVGSGGATYSPTGSSPAITVEAQWSAPSGTVGVPSAPDAVTAAGASGGIQVTWAAPISTGGQTITAYQVEHSTTGAANSWTVASSTIANNATSYTVTGLTGNTSYYIRVAALYSGGRGAYGYPWKKVYGTVERNRDGSNLITYQTGFGTASGDAYSLYSSYTRVRYLMKATYGGNNNYVDADFLNVLQNPSASTTAGFTLDSITNLRIPSTAVGQQFVAQGDVYDLTVLAPSTVSVQNGYGFNGRIEIWPWDYGVAPTSGISTRAAGTYDDGDSLSVGAGWYGSFQLHNLTNGSTDYRQTVFAWNNHRQGVTSEIGFGSNTGTNSDWTFCSQGGVYGSCASRTNFSLEVFINPPVVASSAPGSPTGVVATAGNAQASISWSAPSSNGGATISGYTVTSSPSVTAPAGCTNTSNLSCTFTGLTNGTSYTFTVVAINSVGTSNSSSASTAVTPITTPGAPTGASATASYKQAAVSWTAPASNGGSAITGYTVTSSPSVTAPLGCTNTANLSCTFTGLTAGTAYTFTVIAINAAGNSSASTASSSATPFGDCVVTPTSAGGYKTYVFTSVGLCGWTVPSGASRIEAAAVGGGGGAAFGSLGGGGGGGRVIITDSPLTVSPGDVVIIKVGKGGDGGYNLTQASWTFGSNGDPSSIKVGSTEYSASGGGAGGGGPTPVVGSTGGSGGGGAGTASPKAGGAKDSSTISGITAYGNNGGTGNSSAGGGGGGAGTAGGTGGAGGNGISVWGTTVGGGGGGWASGTGGTGGGGASGSGTANAAAAGTQGTDGLGGGGGGGQKGGSGRVMVRFIETITITPTVSPTSINYGTSTSIAASYSQSLTYTLTTNPTCEIYSDALRANKVSTNGAISGAAASALAAGTYYVNCSSAVATDGPSISYASDATFTIDSVALTTVTTPTLVATTNAAASLTATWTAVSNASSYTVKVYPGAGGTALATITNATSPFVISSGNYSGILGGTSYKVSVTAIGSGGYTNSSESTQSSAVTTISNPTITSMSSSSGAVVGGGTTITIGGTNLSTTSGVTIGSVTATVVSATSTAVVLSIPAATITGNKNLVLTTSVSTVTVSDAYVDCGTSGNFFIFNNSVVGTNYCVGSVVVPTGVTSIANCGFATAIGGNCGSTKGNGITTVSLPTSLRIIYAYGFLGSNMTSIDLPEGLTTIGDSVFYIGGSYTVHIPSTVTSMTKAFYRSNARAVTFASPSSLTSLTDVFRAMGNLTSIVIPDSVTTIGINNFASSFATITMRGVTSIAAGSLPTSLTCIVTSAGNNAINGYSFASFTTAPLIVTDITSCHQPTITSLSVVSGSTSGSTSTVITGTNLINTTGVTVGGNAATITARTTTSVTISTPAGTAGAADVVVTTQAGSVTRANGFTYLGASIAITYNSQSGSAVSNGSTNVGGTINAAPTAPTRTNFTFSGWSTSSAGSIITFPYTHGQTANFTLYAIWIGNSFTLTYDSQGGSSVSSVTTNVGASISAAPAAPTKANYTFSGWAESIGGTALTFPYTHAKTANFTLYAKWTANAYTLTYVYNSATGGNTTATDSFTTGGTQITLPTPTRTGYTFAGWYAESNFTTLIGLAGASYGPTGSSLTPSAYAKWTALIYTVTYASTDATGGSSPIDSTNYNIGNSVAIKGNTGSLVRLGYTFTGWTAASDGTGTVLTSGSPFTVSTSNMTFYPKWNANTYTVTYNKNGASGSPTDSTASYTSGSTAITFTTVGTMAKTGFDFGGWSASPTGTALSGTYTTTSDVTLYAVWTIKSITINFAKGDASASSFFNFPNSRSANYGATITLSDTVDTAVTIGGVSHAFMGWNDGTSVYQSGATYLLGDSSPTFTAMWVKVFAVRYTFNGGTAALNTSAVDSECLQAGNTCTDGQVITANAAPTRAGYTFNGWVDQNNVAVTAGGSMTISTTRYLVYANWSPIDYTISYNTDGGTTAPTSFTKRIGETFSVATAPTKTGYRFNGWSDGTSVLGAGATYYVATSPVTLTAQWIANVYTVIYDWNGGTGSSTSNDSFTVGGTALTLPLVGDHAKDGYTFSGWSETSNGSLLSGGYTPSADTTLYAIWGTGSYTTTYNANGGTVGTSSEAVQNGTSLTLPTPTRSNFVFEGWYTASTGGTKVGNAGASHQPTQSRTLHARWTQSSLYGLAPSALTRIGTTTTSTGSSSTFSSSNANSSVSVTVPDSALPNGTTVNFDLVGDFTRAQSVLTGNNSYIISLVVSWLATDGTVPNTAVGKPIAVTISNASIKAGMSVYAIVAGNVTLLGTSSQDGTVTVNLTSDPEVVVVATKPNAPTSVAATSNGIKQSIVSWTAPSSDGGATISGYTAISNSGATCTTTSTTCTFTGLSDATAYTFTVVATNAQGNSVASSSASATTASSYTVTFDSKGGTSVTSGSFFTGSTVSEPTAPTKTGYTFAGWASVDGGGAETFPFAPGVTSNITMYARWVGSDNAVTFDSKSGSSVTSTVFPSGGTVDEPTAPTKSGFTFEGWAATDGGSVITFPYSPGVTTAITLYAKWTAASNAVTFDSKGGSSVSASTFLSGGSVSEPTAPTKSDYTFAGWSATDGGSAVSFPYSPGVTTDITLFARWTAVSQSSSGGGGGGSSSPAPSTPTPSEPVVPVAPVKSNVTVVAPVTVVGDTETKVPSVDVGTSSTVPGSKPPAVRVDSVSEKFISDVKIVDGKLLLTPETGFSGKKIVTVTITENGIDRFVQIPLTVLPEAVTKPVLTPTASNKSIIRWSESPNADGYTVYLNGKKVCSTTATSCSVKSILGPDAVIEIVSNGGDKTISQRVDAEFKQNAPVSITRLVSATITKATLTKVDTKALDKVIALIKNQGFGTVVISEITTTNKTKALAEARIAAIKKYIDAKTGSEKIVFEVVPPASRTYFNNIAVKG